MNEEIFEIIRELEETQAKSMKLVSKLQHKMGGQMGFRNENYGNRYNMMPGFPGHYPQMGQMGFREDEMMERGRDSMGRYTRG